MNTSNWKPFYKIDASDGKLIETNLIYTPLISPSGNTFCMHFDHTNAYQTTELQSWLPSRPHYTKEMVKFFFDREVKYLTVFKDRYWAPNDIIIDSDEQKIYFSWPGESCNTIIYSNRVLEDYCIDWKEQMFTILKDIVNLGYVKVSLYPHCYFIDKGVLKTFDFYGCAELNNPMVNIKDINGMIGNLSGPRFETATSNDVLNIEILFKEALSTYVKWPDDILPKIYNQLF